MLKRGRRMSWILAAMAIIGTNVVGFTVWRIMASSSGRPEALLWYEPSPLRAEYDKEQARSKSLENRLQTEDSAIVAAELRKSQWTQQDLFPLVVQDESRRWYRAQSAELYVILVLGPIGFLLVTSAVFFFFCAKDVQFRRGLES